MENAGRSTIDDPRSEIDAIDGEILRLLNRRAAIALRVGAVKSGDAASLVDPGREEEVISRLKGENAGPFDDLSIANIFQRIIDESLHLQQTAYSQPRPPVADARAMRLAGASRVAFLGERGTFSEQAALHILGDSCETVSLPTFDELFKAIESGRADLIVAPLENSLIGSVHRCVDLLLESSLFIVAEIVLPVSHFLVACPEATLESIRTVESHPAALAQCTRFFSAHPSLTRVEADDTAGSVRRAVESGDPSRAAIGSRRAAEIYDGNILREHLEDNPENFTRFVLLSAGMDDNMSGEKVSLVIRLKHEAGSLHSALRPIVRRGIDLLKIESMPIKDSAGEFNFYLDLQAPSVEAELTGALNDIRQLAQDVRYLGRYSTVKLAFAGK